MSFCPRGSGDAILANRLMYRMQVASSDVQRRRVGILFSFPCDICIATGENRRLKPRSRGCVRSHAFPLAEVTALWLESAGCPARAVGGPLVGN